jgi:hypothetical protein
MKPETITALRTVKKLNNRIEDLERALKVIHTWATFRDWEMLIPKDVANLCWNKLYGKNSPHVK